MSDRRWFEQTSEEIYAYRARKPTAVFGLPFLGRHWAYVGRTARPELRHAEHMLGGGKWRAVAKPWADLDVERRVLFRKKRRTELVTHLLEWMSIRVLLPVYNVSMNKGNPRRIKPWVQAAQRRQRDAGTRVALVPASLRLFMWTVACASLLSLVRVVR